MSFKLSLVCAFLAICCYVQRSHAIELIELTDANQAILTLDLSKSLRGVQDAYKNGFNFETVKELRKFLSQCSYVDATMKESNDDAFEGMAKQIKDIMAEQTVASACSISPSEIKNGGFDELDTDFDESNYDYLSAKKTDKLATMKNLIDGSPSLSLVLGNLFNQRIKSLSEASLEQASQHVNIFFGEQIKPSGLFDFNYMNYRSTCNIDLIKPICKLVRRSSDPDIMAVADDLSEFVDLFQSGDSKKLAQVQEKSGVSMEDVRESCAAMQNGAGAYLKPIDQIERYLSEDFMTEQDFKRGLAADKDLAFYNELHKLCKLTK